MVIRARAIATAAAITGISAVAFSAWLFSPGSTTPAPQAVLAVVCGQDAVAEYEGTKSCKKCHLATEKSWAETKHAKAFETLKPGNAKEAKEKFKLDPAKDYSTDEACLACHTVGFQQPGGYAIPAAGDEKAAKKSAKMENVGCENCHGPGSKYNEIFAEISKSGRKYKTEELLAVGMKKVDATTCTSCHNEKSPTHPAEPFDYEKMKEKGVHIHEPLKQREG